MQAKHCFFDEEMLLQIPAGTTFLIFSVSEIELVHHIIDDVCTTYGVDILEFEGLIYDLVREGDMQ